MFCGHEVTKPGTPSRPECFSEEIRTRMWVHGVLGRVSNAFTDRFRTTTSSSHATRIAFGDAAHLGWRLAAVAHALEEARVPFREPVVENNSSAGIHDRRRSGVLSHAAAQPARAVQRTVIDRPQPWKLRLSASSINFAQLPIEQACQRIADLGFEAIDIWSAHEGCPHLDDILHRLGADGLRSVLAERKLRCARFPCMQAAIHRTPSCWGRSAVESLCGEAPGHARPKSLSHGCGTS